MRNVSVVLTVSMSASVLTRSLGPGHVRTTGSITARFVSNHPASGVKLAVFTKRTFARYPVAASRTDLLELLRSAHASVTTHKLVSSNATINVKLTGTIAQLGSSGTGDGIMVLLASNDGGVNSVSPVATTRVTGDCNVEICAVNIKAGGITPCPVPITKNMRCIGVPIRVSAPALHSVTRAASKGFCHTADATRLGGVCGSVSGLRGSGFGIGRFTGHCRTCRPFTLNTLLMLLLRVLLHLA